MRTVFLLFGFGMFWLTGAGQSINSKLTGAVKVLEADSQMEHAIMTLYVVNSKTGEVVYAHNSNIGFAAASSQKVITATTAFDVLGQDYRYKTTLAYDGLLANGILNGNLYLKGFGDPSLGSDRYPGTKRDVVVQYLISQLQQAGIKSINGKIYLDNSAFPFQPTPGGWIWDDIGNYYGAGHWALNWHDNQYDLVMRPGDNEGDPVSIIKTEPQLQGAKLINQLSSGKRGSGDNSYIYLPPYGVTGFVTGTVPAGEKTFTVSGSFPNPLPQIQAEFSAGLQKANISGNYLFQDVFEQSTLSPANKVVTLQPYYSPALDSIVYWFLKKSINLYGEALLKTVGFEQTGDGGTEKSLSVLFNHWNKLGVDTSAINMKDGSGLSPQNRITSQAFVQVMQYARSRPWFNAFYNALPEYNGLKMKSGTIGGAKSFTGYATSASGINYTFAIIVNNYTGKASQIVAKMYQVLNVLK